MTGAKHEILGQIADAMTRVTRKWSESLETCYRKGFVHPTREAVGRVEATDFPLPARVQNFAVPFTKEAAEKVAELGKFAGWQADTANAMVARLRAKGSDATPKNFEAEYWRLTKERSRKDALVPDSEPEKEITDDNPNVDWFGPNLPREGSRWDAENRTWVGGQPTPWTEIYAQTAARTLGRFHAEGVTGDILQNTVRLSDGTVVNGNYITRGDSAKEVWHAQGERNAARGLDVSKWRPPTEEHAIAVTATEADRGRILRDAFDHVARPGAFTTETWADVAYKLFQSPQMKNGSDAVIRTYLAGIADHRMGRVPVFPHDIDLRAMTMSQRDFVKYVVDHDVSATSV